MADSDPGPRPHFPKLDNSRTIDVPLDVHPGNVVGEHSALTVARSAFADLHTGWEALQQAARRVKDPDKLAKEARTHVDRVVRNARAANDRCWAAYRHLAERIDAELTQNKNDPMGSEIRAYLSRQESPLSAAQDAVTNGDRRILQAILNAPAQLSGLTRDQQKIIFDVARQEFMPQDFEALTNLDRHARRHGEYIDRFEKLANERIERWRTGDDDALKEIFGDG